MNKFEGKLILQKHKRNQWLVCVPFKYWVDYASGCYAQVEKDFVTDLASVPRLLRSFISTDGQWSRAAVVHDSLYVSNFLCCEFMPMEITRKQADDIFYKAMLEDGVKPRRAWIIYKAVRFGGWVGWNQRRKAEKL